MTTGSCTAGASATSTATTGRCRGWNRRPSRADRRALTLAAADCVLHEQRRDAHRGGAARAGRESSQRCASPPWPPPCFGPVRDRGRDWGPGVKDDLTFSEEQTSYLGG